MVAEHGVQFRQWVLTLNDPMNGLSPRACLAAIFAVALSAATVSPCLAQSETDSSRLGSLERDASGFLENLFGRNARATRAPPAPTASEDVQVAQSSPTDMILRIEQLESQIRQLTGLVEQLQFRNQQLEQQLHHANDAPGSRAVPRPPAEPSPPPRLGVPSGVPAQPLATAEPAVPNAGQPVSSAQRSDVFDPSQNPGAPGAPRTLGALPSRSEPRTEPAAAGVQGEPLDLATMTGRVANGSSAADSRSAAPTAGLPPPPPRNPNATGIQPQRLVMAPSNSPKDEFDLAYGYLQRKDYAVAEENLRAFLQKHPSDKLAADANYWIGESLFLRKRYRAAAEAFLNVSTKFDTSPKVPDSLLRLGQSLAALKEKEAACATLAEIGRRYPRASPSVRQDAQREMKRAGC